MDLELEKEKPVTRMNQTLSHKDPVAKHDPLTQKLHNIGQNLDKLNIFIYNIPINLR